MPKKPPKGVQEGFQILAQKLPNAPKSFVNPSQTLPKPSQNRAKIEPKSIQKASWSLSWINALKKLAFERPKNGQEGPKSAQETPQTLPDPSQMEPKTFPNPMFR